MNERIKALRDRAKNLASQADEIRQRYTGAETMTEEDAVRFDKLMDEHDDIVRDIKLAERDAKIEAIRDTPVSEIDHPAAQKLAERGVETNAEEITKAWNNFLRRGLNGLSNRDAELLKAYQADNDQEMGYLVAPEQMVAGLLKAVDDAVIFRQLSTVYQVAKAESLGVVTLEDDAADPIWTAELQTGDEENDIRLGKRALFPHPLAKQAKISRKLIRQATVDPSTLVLQRLTYRFARVEENAYMTGTGTEQPLGVFTASPFGIDTDRDVVTGANTDFTADGLINAEYTLKPQYRASARWIFHRLALRNIRKLKYGDGTYIWSPGLDRRGEPTILGMPFIESEFAPSTFTQNSYIGLLGDMSYYWIADALDMQFQVLNELYAKSNQIGYIARRETDGMPVLSEAFVRLKLSA